MLENVVASTATGMLWTQVAVITGITEFLVLWIYFLFHESWFWNQD